MPNTFGGEWTRPRGDGRGHSRRELADRASYDNQKSDDCLSSLFFLSVFATTAITALRRRR